MNKTPISLKMITRIRDAEDETETVVEEVGSFIEKGNTAVLTFSEWNENQEKVDSLITIQPEKVNVKRSGAVTMNQQFLTGRETENVYRHEFGTIHMQTTTDQIFFETPKKDKAGNLFIQYKTILNGEEEREHELTISFQLLGPENEIRG